MTGQQNQKPYVNLPLKPLKCLAAIFIPLFTTLGIRLNSSISQHEQPPINSSTGASDWGGRLRLTVVST